MLSARLLQRVEAHWETIANAVVEQTKRDPHTPHNRELDQEEVLARARDLVHHLGVWLTLGDEDAVARRYQEVGRARRNEGIPLAEIVYRLQLIERKTAEYIERENACSSALDIYAELETLKALDRFFATVVYNVVAGYEETPPLAQRRAVA